MDPERIDEVLDEANRLLEEGKPEETLKCLEKVEADMLEGEDRAEWAALRAWALSEMGRGDEALDLLEPLIQEFPGSARLLGTLGVVLSNEDDLDQARAALDEAISIEPDDPVSNANLALVYEKLHDYDNALLAYDRAIELGADIDWALQRKAAVLAERGDYAAAKSTLRRYLSLCPEDASQWMSLAILHSDDEDYEDAFECYKQAEAIEPDSAALRLNWGVTAVRAHDLEQARAQLAALRRAEPDSARPELLRAFILEEEGDLAGAQAIYERQLEKPPAEDETEVAYTLEMAMDYFSRHKAHKRCEKLLRRAYQLNACTVELCEAFREACGEPVEKAHWFSVMVEGRYRHGLAEVYERHSETAAEGRKRPSHFERNFQVIARDRDHAMAMVTDFARRMGERDPRVIEFLREEEIEQSHVGIYEVEHESLVFSR